MCGERTRSTKQHGLHHRANRQMERTQDLENSVSLTTNTHSGIRHHLHTYMEANPHMQYRTHTMHTELTLTPAMALVVALTIGLLDHMMSCVLIQTNCVHFCRQIHPHTFKRQNNETTIVSKLQKARRRSLSFRHSCPPHNWGCSSNGELLLKQEKYQQTFIVLSYCDPTQSFGKNRSLCTV